MIDNEVHGGSAPTFLVRAGLGETAEVDEGAGRVAVLGSAGAVVATADCRRTAVDADTFLVTIAHQAPSGPWRMRLRNNGPAAPRFRGFIAHLESETLHPWAEMELGGALRRGARTRAPRRSSCVTPAPRPW